MAKASPARKNKRLREEALLKRFGLKRNDVHDAIFAAYLINAYLDGRSE